LQGIGQLIALGQFDEEQHALVAFPILPDSQAVGDFLNIVYLIVDFSRAIRTPEGFNNASDRPKKDTRGFAMYKDIVAVAPHVRKVAEVGVQILLVAASFQKYNGMDGVGSSQTSSPILSTTGLPFSS